MKITNAEVIKSGERELIDTIIGDLDWSMIEEIVKQRHHLNIQDDVEYKSGDIVVHDRQVAYKLDFDVKMTLSIVFDRDGNYLSIATSDDMTAEDAMEAAVETQADAAAPEYQENEPNMSGQMQQEDPEEAAPLPSVNPEQTPRENFSRMASHIADMISEINED